MDTPSNSVPVIPFQDPAEVLDEAVAAAQALGVDCVGWMVQRDAEGVVAWLYAVDEDGRFLSLMDEVETFPTLLQAARWCLAVVFDHAREDADTEEE